LKMQHQGTDLVVTWDRHAAEALGATAGLLSIRDGQTQKSMGLNAEELSSGNILLTPESDHIEIRLSFLVPPQRTVSETGIVILPARRAAEPLVLAPTAPSKNDSGTQIGADPLQTKVSSISVESQARNPSPKAPFIKRPPVLSRPQLSARIEPSASLPSKAPASKRTLTAPIADPKLVEARAPGTISTAPAVTPAMQSSPALIPPTAPSAPVRVGGDVQLPTLVSRVDPIYPHAARSGHIHDVVVLEGVVGTNGRVKDLQAISGLEIFRQAALKAVSQWTYSPATLNGKIIEAKMRAEIVFHEGM
jgi:TonB family protein